MSKDIEEQRLASITRASTGTADKLLFDNGMVRAAVKVITKQLLITTTVGLNSGGDKLLFSNKKSCSDE